ncbi:hypothetical protein CON37_31275, partial [Bacillus cereus]
MECGHTPRRPNNDDEHPYLKDSQGDPLRYDMPYYLDPYEFPGQRLVYEWDSEGERRVKLGDSYGKVYPKWWDDGNSALRIDVNDRSGNPLYQALSVKPGTDEVRLYKSESEESQWVVENS